MLVFLDTEFTDFTNCELISIGMVTEDGHLELYLEVQDFDRAKCNSFVQSNVCNHLGQIEDAIVSSTSVQARLRAWFTRLPRKVVIACDSAHDRNLLADVFEGNWPCNLAGWFDLRPLIDTGVFDRAVANYHTKARPWHHALYDAHAHRVGWLAWMDHRQRSN